jgi:uncharacterized protein
MEWRGRRGSNNIEDGRSAGRGRASAGGIGGVGAIIILVLGWYFGFDTSALLSNPGTQAGAPAEMTAADQDAAQFVSVTLADTEEVWTAVFRDQLGRTYQPPVLHLFTGSTSSPCGDASGATGPFYCPGDKKAYLDTAFFATLEQRLGAKGDFASAYVVAHEIGHAVQDQLNTLGRANEYRAGVSEEESNMVSVQIELQADCYAGIWARQAEQTFGSLERGDVQEAINAARQIGDDTLQANAGQRPMPHTFTHGTSEQRSRWFATGYQSGLIDDCNTFSTNDL